MSHLGHFVQYCAQHFCLCPTSDAGDVGRVVSLFGWVAVEVLFCSCVAQTYANHQPGWLFIRASHIPEVRLLKGSRQNQRHLLALI